MNLETLGHIGYQMTYSLNNTITDSGAASSAWASGEKFDNTTISCHDANNDGHCGDNGECDTFGQETNKTGKDVLLGGGVDDNSSALCKYGR